MPLKVGAKMPSPINRTMYPPRVSLFKGEIAGLIENSNVLSTTFGSIIAILEMLKSSEVLKLKYLFSGNDAMTLPH
jgi:hypothetical protein